MMKRRFSNSLLALTSKAALIACLAIITVVPGAFAQDAMKVGVVNFQVLMQDAKAAQSIRDQVEKERVTYQKKIKEMEDKLKSLEEELVKQKSILSEEAFLEKRKSFEKELFEAQKGVQEKKQALERSYGEAMAELRNEILKIVTGVAEENKITLVLPQSQVILAASEMDLTETVLKKLNNAVKKITVKMK